MGGEVTRKFCFCPQPLLMEEEVTHKFRFYLKLLFMGGELKISVDGRSNTQVFFFFPEADVLPYLLQAE